MALVKLSRAATLEEAAARRKRLEIGRYTIVEAVDTLLKNEPKIKATRNQLIESIKLLVKNKEVRDFTHISDDFIAPLTPLRHSIKAFNTTVNYQDLNEVWLPKIRTNWRFPNPFTRSSLQNEPNWIPEDSKKTDLPWGLKPSAEIQRMNGYRPVLHQTLKLMHENQHLTIPTAYEVLESWRVEFKNVQPKDCQIYVFNKSFEYANQEGKRKRVTAKALKEAIQRLITAR